MQFKPYRPIDTSFYGYYGGYTVRRLCSVAPYLGLAPKANTLGRTPGVSALVRLRNEPWIEPALLSIKDFVDEIVVVDSSEDDTTDRVKKVTREHGLNLKHIYKVCDLREAVEIGLKGSTCKWILKWDGDFVGYPSRLKQLRNAIMKLPPEKYYLIQFPLVLLEVDLFHTLRRGVYEPFHIEGFLFTYLSAPCGIHPVHKTEYLRFPKYYEKKYFGKTIYGLHLRSVKPPSRVLERKYAVSWLSADKAKYSNSFQQYMKSCIKRDYSKGLDENQFLLDRFKDKLVPYDKEVYGDYPQILKDYVKKEFDVTL